jgi:predicted transcriptional regulator
MSLAEIIDELPKLSVQDRSVIWQQLEQSTEADVPASFRQSMKDIAEGRHVDMEKALRDVPPPYQSGTA